MKKLVLILGVIFLILTFVGGVYVILNNGEGKHINAGFVAVPGIWTIICFGFYRNFNRK